MADKCYGVEFQHKVSRVVTLERVDALEFVAQIAASGEAGQDDSARMEEDEA